MHEGNVRIGQERPDKADRHRAEVESLRRAIEADQFTNAWHDGWAMDADEAVALALQRDLRAAPK